jgi:hypothetical protein
MQHGPMIAVDLEQRVREAFYTGLSSQQLQAVIDGEDGLDLSREIEAIAFDVTPRIVYPHTPLEVVRQLIELTGDVPTLLCALPKYIIASPDSSHALLSDTPLKLLYVNVLDLAIAFGVGEQARLRRLGVVLPPQARSLYGAMRREQALLLRRVSGAAEFVTLRFARQWLDAPGDDWQWEEAVRSVFQSLIAAGLVRQRQSRMETYDLAAAEQDELLAQFIRGGQSAEH